MRRPWLFAPLALVVLAVGCEDNPLPPAPPPPPQLSIHHFYEGARYASRRLVNDEVYGIFKDSQGGVWFATNEGLNLLPNGAALDDPLLFYDDFNGIPNRQTRAVAELNGTIFVGTWGGGVAYFDGNSTFTALPVANNRVVSNKIFSLAVDDSSLWIGTVNGLTQYIHDLNRPVAQRYRQRSDSLAGDRVVVKVLSVKPQSGTGTEFWCAKQGGGISVIRLGKKTQHFNTVTSDIPSLNVADVAYDKSKDKFVSAYESEGFAVTDVPNSTWTRLTTVDPGIVSDLGQSVGVHHAGTRWLGTQSGLTRMDPDGKVVNFISGSGLPDLRVRRVYVAKDGQVWLSFVSAGAGLVLGWNDNPTN